MLNCDFSRRWPLEPGVDTAVGGLPPIGGCTLNPALDFLLDESLCVPFVSPGEEGIGGSIKESPDDFQVKEVPLYPAQGSGDHLYLSLKYQEENTHDIARALQKLFDLRNDGVGFAGLKDRRSVCEQWFSLYLPRLSDAQAQSRLQNDFVPRYAGMEIKQIDRHNNRLRRGHLAGNVFVIRLSSLSVDSQEALKRSQAILHALQESGFPNYFGLQRFGQKGDNARRGLAVLRGEMRPPRNQDLLESALQSYLFNAWLAERIQEGCFRKVLPGDVLRKNDSGGLFLAEDLEIESRRFQLRETTYTGPLPGKKMKEAAAQAGQKETALLQKFGLSDLRWGAPGSRRTALLYPDGVRIQADPAGLLFEFFLPAGAYATVFLREFTRSDMR